MGHTQGTAHHLSLPLPAPGRSLADPHPGHPSGPGDLQLSTPLPPFYPDMTVMHSLASNLLTATGAAMTAKDGPETGNLLLPTVSRTPVMVDRRQRSPGSEGWLVEWLAQDTSFI
jgi:hypothetical protein